MTSKVKFWIFFLGCIPALLLVPFVCMVVTCWIQNGLLGNSYALEGILIGALMGLVLMLMLIVWLMVVAIESEVRGVRNLFYRVIAFEVLAVSVTFAVVKLWTPKIYDRESLALEAIEAPKVNVSGVWDGSWTDPRRDETIGIKLNLSQSGNSIEGVIVDDSGVEWQIIEGVVSGAKVNIFYDRSHAWPSAGATLLGDVEGGAMSGSYFGHERPRPGWASKGSWKATRVGIGESGERKEE